MLIHFKSIANQNDKENIVKFSSSVKCEKNGDWYSYSFEEPSNKIMNLIEIKDDENAIKIFAGPTTLELELNKNVEIVYKMEENSFILLTFLEKLEIEDKNHINFIYSLKHPDETLIGRFNIFLTIEND